MFRAKLLVQILAFPILVNCSVTNFQISNHVITKKRSYADLDYKITEGFEISDFRFWQRFQDFSQDFQRFQPEAYEISRSEQPLGHTLKKYECVTFVVKWNGAYYTKNVKILISNPDSLVP